MFICLQLRVLKSLCRKVNTWPEVTGLGITDTTVTATARILTSAPSDRSATVVNNSSRLLKKQNGMDSSSEDLD